MQENGAIKNDRRMIQGEKKRKGKKLNERSKHCGFNSFIQCMFSISYEKSLLFI